MIPIKHRLGRASINEVHGTGVHLVGLNNKTVTADGTKMPPYQFFLHDTVHAINIDEVDDPQLATYVRQKMNRLPKPQRQVAWDIFYETTYEQGRTLGELVNGRVIIHGISQEEVSRGQSTLRRIIKSNPYIQF